MLNVDGTIDFSDNLAVRYGGGLFVRNSLNASINGRVTFRNNKARNGGGIHATFSTIAIEGVSL